MKKLYLILFLLLASTVEATYSPSLEVYDGNGNPITSTSSGGHTYLDINLPTLPHCRLPHPLPNKRGRHLPTRTQLTSWLMLWRGLYL